jgi:signal transduction histidine kinase
LGKHVNNHLNGLIIALLLLISAIALASANDSVQPVSIESVEIALLDTHAIPHTTAHWRQINLPFFTQDIGILTREDVPESGSVWLRFYLEQATHEEPSALLFWRYNRALTVYFNGTEIAANSHRDGRTTTSWNRPLLANIAEDRWIPGPNEVTVKLMVSHWGGSMAPILFGPRSVLAGIDASRLFRQVELNKILLAFALTIGLFTLALWLLRRHDSVYLWFSAICFSWALGTSHNIIYHNLIPNDLWLPLVHITIDSCIFFMYGFIGRIANARKPLREKTFLTWTLAAAITHLLIPAHLFWQTAYLIHLVGVLVLGALVLRVALLALHQRQTEAIVITAAIMIQIVLFATNAFQMFFNPRQGWDQSLVYAYLGIPILLLIFAGILLKRFTDALNTSETLNRDLEQKVEVSRQIIAQGFEERRQLEMDQAAEQERLKIYRDLHDDVGSRLLSIIHADTDKKLGDMARSALESLRQAVSKANTLDQPLHQLLADIREESELRLQGSGHSVTWQQSENLSQQIIESTLAFNLNRIMKELVSNIIRHARARRVSINIGTSATGLQITVADDGCGFDLNLAQTTGNGLNNLRSRSEDINASLEYQSGTGGTLVTITVPIDVNELSEHPVHSGLTDKNTPASHAPQ